MTPAPAAVPASPRVRLAAGLIPYLAVGIGVYVLRSAWAAILLYDVAIAVLAWKTFRSALGTRRVRRGAPAVAVITACAAAGPLVFALYPRIGIGDWDATLAAWGLDGVAWLVFVPYFALVHPVLEEVFWQEYAAAPGGAVRPADVLFGGYHALVVAHFVTLPWVAVIVAVLAASSSVWRRLRAWSGGLALPIAAHAVADASTILAVHLIRTA